MKKFIIAAVSFLFMCTGIQAQTSSLKNYFNISEGKYGFAVAMFVNTDVPGSKKAVEQFNGDLSSKFAEVRKISDNNKWLMRNAMDEWSYEPGESYYVVATSSIYDADCLIFYIDVISDEENDTVLLWDCWLVGKNEFDDVQDIADDLKDFASMKNLPEDASSEENAVEDHSEIKEEKIEDILDIN